MRTLIVLVALLAAAPAWACRYPEGGIELGNDHTGFVMTTHPSPIQANKPFRLSLWFCAFADGIPDRVVVDATMPAHRHGMNYRPVVTKTDWPWHVDGLLFHMPGEWEFVFDLYYGERRERLTHRVTLR